MTDQGFDHGQLGVGVILERRLSSPFAAGAILQYIARCVLNAGFPIDFEITAWKSQIQ